MTHSTDDLAHDMAGAPAARRFEIDPAEIQRAIRLGRRARALALRAMVARLFRRRVRPEPPPVPVET